MSEAGKSWITRAIASGVIKAIAYQVTTVATPFVIGGLTLLAGVLGDKVPWMYAITAASLSFGSTAVGAFYILELLSKRAVESKLQFMNIRVAKDIDTGKLCIGIDLRSTALLPIEYEIKEMQTQLNGQYSPKKPYAVNKFTMPAEGTGFFNDFAIEGEVDYMDTIAKGTIVARLLYGRPGNLKYELPIKLNIALILDTKTNLMQATWNHAA